MTSISICEHDEKARLNLPDCTALFEWPYANAGEARTVTVEFYRCMSCGVVLTKEAK